MMSEIEGIQGGQSEKPRSSEELECYKGDYNEGFKLFQNAFSEYNKPNLEAHKKAKLQDVMDKALNVMNETACVAISEGKRTQEAQLSSDYKVYINNPTPENQKKVSDDINALKS